MKSDNDQGFPTFSIFAAIMLLAFPACESIPLPDTSTGAPSAGQSLAWQTSAQSGGNASINLLIDGKPYLIETAARSFRQMPRSEFAQQGVPASGQIAAYFWAPDSHEEDGQKMYVAREASRVVVYSGYMVPGALHDVQWEVKRSIEF